MLDGERSYVNKEEVRVTVVQPCADCNLLAKRSGTARRISEVCVRNIGNGVSEDFGIQKVIYQEH